ncbi:Receptor-like kinase tmk4 [Turnera subulata]|uniref:non-specific serine/threonine protein kinase n=1 Tax=Turnera subulata TaxID=218843 RepID=A0A9Q0G965_9ROSI|nr:Receptor-like kinase tmk4 [Turnera subulata]
MAHHRHLLLSLLFFFFSLLSSPAAADDGAVILELAKALSPTPSGWSTTSSSGFCKWPGIKCDNSNRVTSINLSDQSLSGTLPPDLASLSALTTLSLQQNHLGGALPSLAGLASLQELYLSTNNFTSIPGDFFQGLSSLRVVRMSENSDLAPWAIPAQDLSQCTSLTTFEASGANIIGTIPDMFGSLASLQSLRLSYNNLTGSFPKSLGSSGILNLWVNNQLIGLSGSIEVLSSMTQLSQVWLQKNQFTGPIPDLSKCQNLFDLQLRDNIFTGVVPPSLVSLPGLVNISLSNNKLQGPMPAFGKDVKVDNSGLNKFCQSTPGDCDPQVTTLIEVARGFGFPVLLSDSWPGNDACDNWPFVTCDKKTGKVNTVSLGKHNFGGTISPAFANLTDLTSLLLNDNNLTGPIPDSFSKLTNLQVLDVSNNNLSGPIPPLGKTRLVSNGNPLLGGAGDSGNGTSTPGSSPGGGTTGDGSSGTGNGSKKVSPSVIAGAVIGAVIVIAIILFVLFKYNVRKKKAKSGRVNDQESGIGLAKNGAGCCTNGYGAISEMQSQCSDNHSDRHFFEGGNIVISIEVLRQVTNNFSDDNILGKGGFGVVYKGELHDGTKIAVKRMESGAMGTKGMNEFQAEIAVLTKVRHRHLVALLGYCINGNERLLVYEYMPQGTLAQHLFEWREHDYPPLTWKQRVTIALDVARGVEYLHSLAQQSFIHRDLKPSNILLGDDMRAKVADFGLVKNAPDGKYSMETRLAGTFGYLAPEYAATGRVTTKVDVYAFGVILMEIITGRKALDDTVPDERSHLVTWFRRVLINKENVPKAIDQTLDPDEETMVNIFKVAELAGHCTAREPYQRPDMGHAVNVLGPLVEQWKPTNHEEEETSGIDMHMSLPQFLQRWQADEGTSTMFGDRSYTHTQSSIPAGFSDSFNSTDCR